MGQYAVYLLPAVTIVALLCFFFYYWKCATGPLEWISCRQSRGSTAFSCAGRRYPMERKDALPLLLITAIYAVTAFANLGSIKAPQSFAPLDGGKSLTVTLSGQVYLTGLRYYTGLGTGAYELEISTDGETWLSLWARRDKEGNVSGYYWADGAGFDPSYAISQEYNGLFKWQEITPENPQNASYLRITGRSDKDVLELGELALYSAGQSRDPNGLVNLSATGISVTGDGGLFDEQNTVPDKISWRNSAYFDEIYHPRTAYEHIRGFSPYEVSHPPLGKLIIGLGVQLFGMTPFGWRFMGALFGVLMVPLLYLFIKNLFGKTKVAACGAILLAADFMHLTQTRIATIDTYGVFFILLMYYFMYRYLTLPPGAPFRKCALPLLLSGLFWGIGAASKWTVIYGCAGLVILYFIGLFQKVRAWPAGREDVNPTPWPWLLKTLLFSVLVFVLIPAVIYTLSYLPYAYARGDMSPGGLLSAMWENQKYMFSYHSGVVDTHPYSSRWYQWMVNARPILYYLDTNTPGVKEAFGAFLNPVVCWGGLVALVSMAVQLVRRRCGRALFILIGYLSQLLPWLFIGRITFEYHYFPSMVFLVLALCYLFNDLMEFRRTKWKPAVYGMTGGAVALYALFYPVLAGVAVPAWYTASFLKWFPAWPF